MRDDEVLTTSQAVALSVACARRLGLPAEQPEVVAEGYSVRVRLAPSPVLTRVITEGVRLRGDPLPWLQREVTGALHLAAKGVPVIAPWSQPGPHVIEGHLLTLWEWVDEVPGEVGQAALGEMLGALHTALLDIGDLPFLAGPLTDIASALALSDDPVLHQVASELLPLTAHWPRQGLHGDVHTRNLLMTQKGPLWSDLEDLCVGPVEWDLASLTLTRQAIEAYPAELNAERLRDCQDLRRLQVLAGLLTDALSPPTLREEIVAGLTHRL